MEKRLIVNAVEADAALPLKQQYIESDRQAFLDWVYAHPAETYIAVTAQGSPLTAWLREQGFETVETDGRRGLVCQDPSAMLRAVDGEKPLPCHLWPEQAQETVINVLECIPHEGLLSLVALPDDGGCALQMLLHLVDRLCDESCGKCVFCREALGQMQSILSDIAAGRGGENDLATLEELTELLSTQVVCSFGPAAAAAIRTVLDSRAEEIEEHIRQKLCRKAVCGGLVFYKILGAKCTGCEECADVCPEDAIAGKARFIHVISEIDCTRCGKCMEVCEESAIVKCSADKPVCPVRPVPVGSWHK